MGGDSHGGGSMSVAKTIPFTAKVGEPFEFGTFTFTIHSAQGGIAKGEIRKLPAKVKFKQERRARWKREHPNG